MTYPQFQTSPPAYYKLSGRVSPLALFAGLPTSLFLSALIGFASGMLGFFCHTIRFTKFLILGELLTVAATGALLGLLNALLFENLGSRSRPFNILSAIASALVALYFAWGGWLFHWALFSHHYHSPLTYLDPFRLVFVATALYNHGTYTLLNQRIEGPAIVLMWIGEAAGFIGFSLAVTSSRSCKNVYCEQCKRWGNRRTVLEFRDENVPELESALLAGNFEPISSAIARDLTEDRWCCLLFEGCPTCDNTQSLTLQRTLFLREANGRTRIKNTPLIHRLLLTPEQTAKIAMLAAAVQPPVES